MLLRVSGCFFVLCFKFFFGCCLYIVVFNDLVAPFDNILTISVTELDIFVIF